MSIPNRRIESILDKLSKPIEDSNIVIQQLIEFYLVNERHRYSRVASFINQKAVDDEQVMSYIMLNISELINDINKNGKIQSIIDEIKNGTEYENNNFNVEQLVKNLEKLNDHIELEFDRMMLSQKRERTNFSNILNEYSKKAEEAQKSIEEKAARIEEKLSNTVISVLGIFSAIIIAFFGGLNVLANLFTYLPNTEVSIYRLTFIGGLTGFIVFNIIFMLLHFISKILDRNIGGVCSEELITQADNCKLFFTKNKFRMKVNIKRHPLFIVFNIIIISIMIASSCIWMIKGL